MYIQVELLKKVIDAQVDTIKKQFQGTIQPTFSKYEALDKLGIISSIILGIYDKLEDSKLKEEVWSLKEEADNLYQELMELS